MESGCSVWRSKTETVCGTPLSRIVKSSLFSDPTSSPAGFLTVARTRTRLTSTRMVVSCALRAAASRRARLALLRDRRMFVPLPFRPDLTILEVLLLPDGNQPLEPVDAFAGGLESRPAVSGGDDNRHAGLADQ